MNSPENLYQPPTAEQLEPGEPAPVNPHKALSQIVGMLLASALLIMFVGWLLVVTGWCVFADAWHAGIYKKLRQRSFLNISPLGWGIVTQGFFILGYPLYLIYRARLKTKPGNTIFFVLTLVTGSLYILSTVLLVYEAWYSGPL